MARDRGLHRLRVPVPALRRAFDVGKEKRHLAGRKPGKSRGLFLSSAVEGDTALIWLPTRWNLGCPGWPTTRRISGYVQPRALRSGGSLAAEEDLMNRKDAIVSMSLLLAGCSSA